jgi:hypothetical protein
MSDLFNFIERRDSNGILCPICKTSAVEMLSAEGYNAVPESPGNLRCLMIFECEKKHRFSYCFDSIFNDAVRHEVDVSLITDPKFVPKPGEKR